MCESLVGLSHAVNVLSFLHRSAAIVDRIEQLANQAVAHLFFASLARVAYDPADRQGIPAVARYFERYLVSCAADTA
jgi:hypothetical protein